MLRGFASPPLCPPVRGRQRPGLDTAGNRAFLSSTLHLGGTTGTPPWERLLVFFSPADFSVIRRPSPGQFFRKLVLFAPVRMSCPMPHLSGPRPNNKPNRSEQTAGVHAPWVREPVGAGAMAPSSEGNSIPFPKGVAEQQEQAYFPSPPPSPAGRDGAALPPMMGGRPSSAGLSFAQAPNPATTSASRGRPCRRGPGIKVSILKALEHLRPFLCTFYYSRLDGPSIRFPPSSPPCPISRPQPTLEPLDSCRNLQLLHPFPPTLPSQAATISRRSTSPSFCLACSQVHRRAPEQLVRSPAASFDRSSFWKSEGRGADEAVPAYQPIYELSSPPM